MPRPSQPDFLWQGHFHRRPQVHGRATRLLLLSLPMLSASRGAGGTAAARLRRAVLQCAARAEDICAREATLLRVRNHANRHSSSGPRDGRQRRREPAAVDHFWVALIHPQAEHVSAGWHGQPICHQTWVFTWALGTQGNRQASILRVHQARGAVADRPTINFVLRATPCCEVGWMFVLGLSWQTVDSQNEIDKKVVFTPPQGIGPCRRPSVTRTQRTAASHPPPCAGTAPAYR